MAMVFLCVALKEKQSVSGLSSIKHSFVDLNHDFVYSKKVLVTAMPDNVDLREKLKFVSSAYPVERLSLRKVSYSFLPYIVIFVLC